MLLRPERGMRTPPSFFATALSTRFQLEEWRFMPHFPENLETSYLLHRSHCDCHHRFTLCVLQPGSRPNMRMENRQTFAGSPNLLSFFLVESVVRRIPVTKVEVIVSEWNCLPIISCVQVDGGDSIWNPVGLSEGGIRFTKLLHDPLVDLTASPATGERALTCPEIEHYHLAPRGVKQSPAIATHTDRSR